MVVWCEAMESAALGEEKGALRRIERLCPVLRIGALLEISTLAGGELAAWGALAVFGVLEARGALAACGALTARGSLAAHDALTARGALSTCDALPSRHVAGEIRNVIDESQQQTAARWPRAAVARVWRINHA